MTRPAEAAGAGAPTGTSPVERAREDFLHRVLDRLESGALSPAEYTERVRLLELATTIPEMADVAEGAPRTEPALDPVDMLLVARSAERSSGTPSRPRYFIVAVLLFFFVVLLVLGLWLVAHARALHNSGNLGMAPSVAMPSVAMPGSA